MTKKDVPNSYTIAVNKRAQFEYFIEERIEAGLVLQGWEVKSLRAGKGQITDSYVLLREGEAYVIGMHITPLKTVSTHVVADPDRTRKLLLNKKEISKLIGSIERKGYTAVVLSIYWKNNKVKCQIAIAKGKQTHDKRETIKQRDWQREKAAVMKHSR